MKPCFPILVILLLVSTSFIGVSNTLEESIEESQLPTELIIEGPTLCKVGIEYEYTIYLIEPEDDVVWFRFNYGDGEWTDWIGPYDSDEKIIWGMSWPACGVYTIQVEALCNVSYYNASITVTVIDYNIIYVDDDNTDGPWDGTIVHPYQYIQDGIDNASDADTVFVYNGTYVENLIVQKSVNLIGKDRNTTVIDGNRSGSVINITTDEVTINGFTIQNGECDEESGGILVRDFNSTRIINNIIYNNSILGINLDGGFGYIIERNIFISNDIGIECNSNHSNISYNFFINNVEGIEVWGDYNIISYNNFRGCDSTSIMFGGSDHIITENIINGSGRGKIYWWGEILAPSGGERTIISDNTIINFDGEYISGISLYFEPRDNIIVGNVIKGYSEGISLRGRFDTFVDNTLISGNILQDNDEGIFLSSCRKTNISGNILQNNTDGAWLCGCWKNSLSYNIIMDNNDFGIWFSTSNFNKVFKNNFMNNGKNAHFSWLSLKNSWKGNFWDKERESPYPIIGWFNPGAVIKIPWLNFDWNPAQEPYDIEV